MDKTRGIIKTTVHYRAESNSTFYLRFRFYDRPYSVTYPNLPQFPVKVTSKCDQMTVLYRQMSDVGCDKTLITMKNGSPGDVSKYAFKFDPLPNTHHVTQINIDFAHFPVTKNLLEVKENDRLKVRVSVDGSELPTIDVYYRREERQVAYLKRPYSVGSDSSIEVKMYDDSDSQRNIDGRMFAFVLIEAKDFCTAQPKCVRLAGEYREELKKNVDYCSNIDELTFGQKYGFCTGKKFHLITNFRIVDFKVILVRSCSGNHFNLTDKNVEKVLWRSVLLTIKHRILQQNSLLQSYFFRFFFRL